MPDLAVVAILSLFWEAMSFPLCLPSPGIVKNGTKQAKEVSLFKKWDQHNRYTKQAKAEKGQNKVKTYSEVPKHSAQYALAISVMKRPTIYVKL